MLGCNRASHFIFGCLLVLVATKDDSGDTAVGCQVTNSTRVTVRNGQVYIEAVARDVLPGDVLATLQATYSGANFSVDQPNHYIGFDVRTQAVILAREVVISNSEDKSQTLRLSCLIAGTVQATVNVTVHITDTNDDPPAFSQPVYTAVLNELAKIRSVVVSNVTVLGVYPDNMNITCHIRAGKFSHLVSMSNKSPPCVVVLARTLDYERQKTFSVVLEALDHHAAMLGRPAVTRTAEATLIVTIEDGDDQDPTFVQDQYTAEVGFDSILGSDVRVSPPIHAYDQDEGIGARIAYSIHADNYANGSFVDCLRMDRETGHMEMTKHCTLDEEFSALVLATKETNKRRSESAIVHFRRSRVRRQAFESEEIVIKLVENTPVGTIVMTLAVLSVGATARYSIESPQQVIDFTINTKTAAIGVNKELDFERRTQYDFYVQLVEGTFTDRVRVVIDILDLNEFDPVFEETTYSFSFPTMRANQLIGIVKATDNDGFSNVTYAIMNRNVVFLIERTTGKIRVASTPSNKAYLLYVKAEDGLEPPRSSSIMVHVEFSGTLIAHQQNNILFLALLGTIAVMFALGIVSLRLYNRALQIEMEEKEREKEIKEAEELVELQKFIRQEQHRQRLGRGKRRRSVSSSSSSSSW
ncbi:Protocadherin Fat 4 [Lamellibrachia satsuma]|nr:Protocadherin Fat 4 [Lamellibrachia satsuma]